MAMRRAAVDSASLGVGTSAYIGGCANGAAGREGDTGAASDLPRVRMRWMGMRRMEAGDPFAQKLAATTLAGHINSAVRGATPAHNSRSNSNATTVPSLPYTMTNKLFFMEKEYCDTPYVVRVTNNCVAFLHRGTHLVERRFVFPDRVIDAVMAYFDPIAAQAAPLNSGSGAASVGSFEESRTGSPVDADSTAFPSRKKRGRRNGLDIRPEPHLCVLVRSDCVNIYTPSGDVFEAALPFQANRLFPMGSGLLMQRIPATQPSVYNKKTDTPNSTLYVDKEFSTRPRFFTLAHPLDEIKPVALATASSDEHARKTTRRLQKPSRVPAFLCDPALEIVALSAPHSLFVCYHQRDRRFCVYRLRPFPVSRSQRVAPIQVVDSLTWQKHREKELDRDDEQVTMIDPDWVAEAAWVAPPSERASTVNLGSSTASSSSRSAFLASDLDRAPLLCLMDKTTGVLMLKRIDSLTHHRDTALIRDTKATELEDVQLLRCRDALPISADPEQRSSSFSFVVKLSADSPIDIVVMTKEGKLQLHRGIHPICELTQPSTGQDTSIRSSWPLSTQIRMKDGASCFEVCGHDLINYPEMLHRSGHPLRVLHSPLLEKVFAVLDMVLPPRVVHALRADVIAYLQHRADAGEDHARLPAAEYSSEDEWTAFQGYILSLLDDELVSHPQSGSSSEVNDELQAPAMAAFDKLCQSSFHQMYQLENPMLFLHVDAHLDQQETSSTKSIAPRKPILRSSSSKALIQPHTAQIFAGLHLLYEDLKLSVTSSQMRLQLSALMLDMSFELDLQAYSVYYQQENCVSLCNKTQLPPARTKKREMEPTLFAECDNSHVPDIIRWIHVKVQSSSDQTASEEDPFPTLASIMTPNGQEQGHQQQKETPLWRMAAICHIYDLLFPLRSQLPEKTQDREQQQDENTASLMVYLTRESFGIRLNLQDLPFAIQFPIAETISKFRHAPPPFITEDVCEFIGREDLAGDVASRINLHVSNAAHTHHGSQFPNEPADVQRQRDDKPHEVSDGLEEVVASSQQLFPLDQRMKEVARLVRSSRPLCLKLEKTSDVSDQDYVLQQQARLLVLCKRSMSLPVARGMITLGSFDVNMTQNHAWQLRVPDLPLVGRTPPTNAIVSLDITGYAKELTFWPQFHNGCAAGLRLPARDLSSVVNRYWIKYHRPSVADHQARIAQRSNGQTAQSPDASILTLEEGYAAHAGLLLGLGLRGHLKCLSMADVYNYLSLSNEFVTVAILLGMATTAAHCRQRRKRLPEAIKMHRNSENGSNILESSPLTPSTDAGADAGLADVTLDDDTFTPGSSKNSKAPLVESSLELTLERSVSKMLCLHIPSLLPPPFADFSVPASTQTAALLGLGVLYQATGHRLMTELLLTEITRSPSSVQFVSSNTNSGLSTASFGQLEGYALAAGLALGLVVLGRGQTKSGDPGLADMKLEEKLYKYIVGGAQQLGDANAPGGCLYRGRKWDSFGHSGSMFDSRSGTSGSTETPSVAGREPKILQDHGSRGEHVNVGVTACGSALALAFMYMQTENKSIAAQLRVPDTLILLDNVRPDILMVRTLAKNLVLWDSVTPTIEWIEDVEVPVQLKNAYKTLQAAPAVDRDGKASPTHADAQSICEAYANIATGACFSIGIRFAGTSDAQARKTLRKYILHFREMRSKAASIRVGSNNAIVSATERVTIERCLAACAQALALVDAGSGNVETLTLLRSINLRQRVDSELTYGNHMALSMAIGLLFIGGGRATVSRSKEAIASLVISLFPMFPMNTADNKYHLQAFRHLYVLAVDTSRLLETIDVNSGSSCSVQVRVQLRGQVNRNHTETKSWQTLQSPCLLPDLSSIKRIIVSGEEFYSVEIVMPVKKLKVSSGKESRRAMTANALRLELLREKNMILLKRRKRSGPSGGDLAGISNTLSELHHAGSKYAANDKDDHLMLAFRSYFLCETDQLRQNKETSSFGSWWSARSQQLVAHHVHEEVSSLLSLYLNTLHALFQLQHPPFQSSTGLRNLKLYIDYCEATRHRRIDRNEQDEAKPFTSRDHGEDFVVWLKHQTEVALRDLWRNAAAAIASSASAQVRVLGTASVPNTVEDTFLMNSIARYFAAPSTSVFKTPREWQTKFQQLLSATCSSSSNASNQFQLREFLDNQQDHVTEQEKAFWLQLVSFFLFAN
ncbi:Anaphase-promoting complex subunit, partial [Globisporangium splendens]